MLGGQARKLRSDLQAIVDEFGEKLFEEMDYVQVIVTTVPPMHTHETS
jgi:hypothetical protein